MHSPIAKRRLTGCLLAGLILLQVGSVSGRDATLPAFALSRAGQPAGYLVGTMHTEDPRVMALLETLEPLLREVDVLAIELVPDGVTMLAVAAATLLPAASLSAANRSGPICRLTR